MKIKVNTNSLNILFLQMVKMRKDIKKAKGQVILKLLRKIKDLKNKK